MDFEKTTTTKQIHRRHTMETLRKAKVNDGYYYFIPGRDLRDRDSFFFVFPFSFFGGWGPDSKISATSASHLLCLNIIMSQVFRENQCSEWVKTKQCTYLKEERVVYRWQAEVTGNPVYLKLLSAARNI